MGKTADVSPRRRNVRCPKCRELLSEPESPIYQCPFCFILLRAKGVPPDFQGESWQMPRTEDNQGIESSQQRNELEAKSTDGTEGIGSLRQVQLNDHEINEHASTDGNIRQQELVLNEDEGLVVENKREQERQLENDYGNKSTGGNDVWVNDASQISTDDAEEGMAVVCEERERAPMSNNGASPEMYLLLDRTIQQQLPSKDAENCVIPSASEEKKEFSSECAPSGEGDEENFQSEIIRDNDYELSFKYISSGLKSNDQLVPRKRSPRLSNLSSEGSVRSREPLDAHLTETRPFSSNENSDDSESYSCASESASNESVDSDFDFQSPSGQNMPPPNFSDELVPQKMPLPDVGCDAPPNLHQLEWQDDDHENAEIDLQTSNGASSTPHHLEWQDVDHKSEEIPLQSSNGAVASSDEVDAKTASDVRNGVDAKTASDVLTGVDQVERTEVKRHLQNNPLKNETVLVGLDDTAATVRECFHAQGENTDLIGDPANMEGSVIPNKSDNAEVEKDCNGCHGSVVYELNKHKAMATTVPNFLDLLLPGAELLLKSNSGASLEEGTTNAGKFVSGTEDPLRSLTDGSDFETCLAPQKNIELVHSVVNVKLEDSIATIASKNVVFTGKPSQANVDPHMICTEKIQERSSDPLHPQQNTSLSDAYNQCRRASTQGDVSAKRDLKSDYAAQNTESDSGGVQLFPLPLVTETGNSSSHNAVNDSESRLFYRRNYPSEATQWGGREDVVNMFDSRVHRRRTSLEETRMQSELSNKYTSQVQKNMPSEGVHISRSRRLPEESSNMHRRHAEVAYEPTDGQGPWLQKQNHQADVHMMQHSMNYSGPSNGFTPGNFPPFGSPYYANGSDSFAMGVPNASLGFTYQAPSHSWMLPPVMPGFHYGCHSAAPVCMTCIHGQHSHMPQLPMPPCGGPCFNQPLPVAHQQGHMGCCNHHQAHQVKGPDQKASAVFSSPPRFSPQMVHLHDIAEGRRKPPMSSARKLKHYPPLPQSNTAPYIICKGCDEILEVPKDIPPFYTAVQKVRCGACKKIAKFSVCKDNQGTHNAVLETATTNKVSVSMSHAAQYNKPSRPPAVPNVVQNTDSHQGMSSGLHSQYKQGSFDSQQLSVSMSHTAQYNKLSRPPAVPNVVQNTDSYQGMSSGLHSQYKQGSFGSQQQISAASKKRGSLSFDEAVQPTKCELDTSDQDEFFFRSLSRYSEIDSSRIFFNGFKAASSAIEANNFDGMLVGNVMDEKEEGLDFGAPQRMSDGESLDQRSPESRMRSPENKQHFRLMDQRRHTNDSLRGEEYAEEAALDLKRKMIAEGKKPSASLYMLLNQQSSKFDIYRDKRVSFDESGSALFSTASSSPMDDDCRSERRSYVGDCGTSHTAKVSSSNCVGRTEPKSVVGMLRRSLKHFSRGH